jgi:hypothetical protein
VLSEIIFSPEPLDLVYHLENPVRQPWNEVLDILSSELDVAKQHDHHPPSIAEWVQDVKQHSSKENNPAAALADFFEQDFEWMSGGSIVLSTETSRRHSPTLRRVGPVREETVRTYLQYWRGIGLIRGQKN